MVDKTIEAEAAQGLQPPQILDVLTATTLQPCLAIVQLYHLTVNPTIRERIFVLHNFASPHPFTEWLSPSLSTSSIVHDSLLLLEMLPLLTDIYCGEIHIFLSFTGPIMDDVRTSPFRLTLSPLSTSRTHQNLRATMTTLSET
ncbi:hypothetical protein AFLA_011276 [Aspergillus flavus NRRL3357]|nr:hypothetical protein AFLA_011276 [Aspergillus flavus NRRL3357]